MEKEGSRQGNLVKCSLNCLHNERGMALVISLLMLAIVTTIGMASIMATSTELHLGGNKRVTAETLYVAEAGVQHALRELKGQDFDVVVAANVGQSWITVSDFNGTPGMGYTVKVSNTSDSGNVADTNSIFVTSIAVNPSGGSKTIEAEVSNPALTLPINASMSVSGNFSRIKFSGNATINGDLPADETPVVGSDCAEHKAGISVDSMDTYTDIDVKKHAGDNITGIGLNPSIQLRPSDMSPTMVQNIASLLGEKADQTIIVDDKKVNNDDVVWGTVDDPQVTVIMMTGEDVRMKFNGNTTGYGILIINSETSKKGRVEFNGNFEWNGLIVITGDAGFDRIKANGNDSITGGIILANTNEDTSVENFRIKSNGNTSIQYSCKALTNAIGHAPLILNSWHEL
ncbi:MAG: pilus assembly PilX N-terminal domain-containing protein [Nitrospira sp.]|nr:hypothetical protein [Candidatus Manganitrophaceae bacterium]HIL35627.1 hypothetical protein [Candidatus Manganitrophaceae bacterium]